MGCQVNIAEAKAKLSELLERVLGGGEFVIARAGKPSARLAPLARKRLRKPGAWRHMSIPDEISWNLWLRKTSTPPRENS
jgi:prevent-host-death family protein